MAQAVNIVYLLLCHLNRHKWFELPGVGVFTAVQNPSYIDHIEKKIIPANLSVHFNPVDSTRTEIMIQNMISETGFDQKVLEEHLAAICHFINQGLKSKGLVEFKPFGLVSQSGEEIRFEQSPENIHLDFYLMDPLHLEPAIIPQFKKEILVEPAAPLPIRKTKSKKQLTILIFAIAALWIIFLSFLFCPSKSNHHKSSPAVSVEDSLSLIKEPVAHIDSLDSNNLEKDLTNEVDSISQFNNEVLIDSSNIEELDKMIKYKPCVIIVGSFKWIPYADRMAKQVSDDGFVLFRERFGKFHRVGVEFNCFEHDLQQMVDALRQKYHPEAWVLKF